MGGVKEGEDKEREKYLKMEKNVQVTRKKERKKT